MKKIILGLEFCTLVITGGLSLTPKTVKCEDCNKGKECTTSFDCGEIGVCYCQYSYEETQEEGGAIPESGTCYFE